MPTRLYPFYRLQDARGRKTPPWRLYLPVRISNPASGSSVTVYGLVDTGADATLLPASLAAHLGHDLKGDGVKARLTKGIEGAEITVYRHSFDVDLLTASGGAVARSFRNVLIDCSASDVPVLLGASDFLTHFSWSVDYRSGDLALEW
jgi:hypothetical protein